MLRIRAFHILEEYNDLEFDEFCRKLVLDMLPYFDTFKDEETTWNYVNSHLGFVEKQLIGLYWTSFHEKPSIVSIIDKFIVDVEKALDRKLWSSFLSLVDKNWWTQQCQSEDMILEKSSNKSEIKVPPGQFLKEKVASNSELGFKEEQLSQFEMSVIYILRAIHARFADIRNTANKIEPFSYSLMAFKDKVSHKYRSFFLTNIEKVQEEIKENPSDVNVSQEKTSREEGRGEEIGAPEAKRRTWKRAWNWSMLDQSKF
ncbi:hypothetical protein AMTR_s00040p00095710 [Amborella trichopoda]|uniref:Uncharacterized protein n=1 Tax=Amborella trichopoda TaxID=13333 RepID=W1PY78_AMBTC|nr:hypothetical protein AMTR_s00040p00095710 [Amborella trichopoda]